MDNKEKQFSLSWFFRWFLDNKAITVFLVTLLLGLNLLVLSKITFIFIPIFEFAGAVMPVSYTHLTLPTICSV